MKRKISKENYKFIDNMLTNDATYIDYLERFKKICLSMFEWVNLPSSMNARWLERTLYYKGQAGALDTKKYGRINTGVADGGYINIYGLPTQLNCYAFSFHENRRLFSGLDPMIKNQRYEEAVLIMNNWERIPTAKTMELFAYRLYMAQRTIDTNLSAQRTPVMILVNEKQRLLMENLYNEYNGNAPFIFGDRSQLTGEEIKAINTEAPFIIDKVSDYKKEIWNEALTFLGINNIMLEKKERLVSDEANSNNEVINMNLQSFLAPRLEACKQMNELFGLTGTDKEIKVRIRSDLYNIVKQEMSITKDYNKGDIDNDIN